MEEICSEMDGTVWKVLVAPGDQVQVGALLMVLEAMKMEVPVEANIAGVVSELRAAEGDAVRVGDVLAVVQS